MKLSRGCLFLLMISFFVAKVAAQKLDVTETKYGTCDPNDSSSPKCLQLEFLITPMPLDIKDLNEDNFRLAKIDPIGDVVRAYSPPLPGELGVLEVQFSIGGTVNSGDVFILAIEGLKLPGKKKPTSLQKRFQHPVTTSGIGTVKVAKARGKKDASIYLAGEVVGASGVDANVSLDAKVQSPPFGPPEVFGRQSNLFLTYELKTDTAPEADPDTMKFGLDWRLGLGGTESGFSFGSLLSGAVEAQRSFDTSNAVFSPSVEITYSKYGVIIEPFAGIEVGANLNNPIKRLENDLVARFLFGSNLIVPLIKKPDQDVLIFEGTYSRRVLFEEEIGFRENDEGDLEEVFVGKGPREFAEAKLSFSKGFWGFSVGYEYGELPPAFKLVDHKFKIGFTFKLKFDRK